MPDGYVRCGGAARPSYSPRRDYEEARDAALIDLKRHPDLDHDEEIWVAFTERIVRRDGRHGTAFVARG